VVSLVLRQISQNQAVGAQLELKATLAKLPCMVAAMLGQAQIAAKRTLPASLAADSSSMKTID